MGMRPIKRCMLWECNNPDSNRLYPTLPIAPDPHNFTINDYYQTKHFLVVKINYPDCNNFEGNKTLVFENVTIDELRLRKQIDPHFAENNNAPIARFKPGVLDWHRAIYFVDMMEKIK